MELIYRGEILRTLRNEVKSHNISNNYKTPAQNSCTQLKINKGHPQVPFVVWSLQLIMPAR
jgi:hypothetical protein